MKEKMPALFIGHGSPMNCILDNSYTQSLRALGRSLPRPEAIMVVSAHWLTAGTFVGCMARPETIHDFSGFPDALYALRYPSPGAAATARAVTELVRNAQVRCRDDWGLDHAAWAVLRHMYPEADVPVFEMSLDYSFNEWHPKPLRYHYDLGKELAALRRRGVLILGSGNIVHNLGMLDFENIDAEPFAWAEEFDAAVKDRLESGDHEGLLDLEALGPSAALAVPTLDHYLPLLSIVALQEKDDPLTFPHEGMQHGSISMRCVRIG